MLLIVWVVELEQLSDVGKVEALFAFLDVTQNGPLYGHFLVAVVVSLVRLEVERSVQLNQVTPECLQRLWRVDGALLLINVINI